MQNSPGHCLHNPSNQGVVRKIVLLSMQALTPKCSGQETCSFHPPLARSLQHLLIAYMEKSVLHFKDMLGSAYIYPLYRIVYKHCVIFITPAEPDVSVIGFYAYFVL